MFNVRFTPYIRMAIACVLYMLLSTGVQAQFWAQRAGGTGSDEGNSIARDAAGNVYVTGYFSGTATFGGTTLTSSGGNDIFVVKYNSNGVVQWAVRHGGTSIDMGYGIAVDGSGNVYVTGSFQGIATFGSTTLTASGTSGWSDIFVVKYNTSGVVQWAQRHGGTSIDMGYGIAVDGSGNVYVTGYFQGTATFGSTTLTNSSTSYNDIFVVKYNTSGVVQWAQRHGGTSSTSSDVGYGIAVDGSGNVYVTGYFQGTATFGSTTLTSSGSYDIFVVKYNTSGVVQWAQRHGGTSINEGPGIAVDGSGNVYVTGYFIGTATFGGTTLTSSVSYDIFVVKYNTSGVVQWAQRAGGTSTDEGKGIAVDSSGNVYVTGYFGGTATFGSTTLTSSGFDDIFVVKYNSTGVVQWAQRAGGTSYDEGRGIAVDGSGNVYVTGSFSGTATFGSSTLTSSGNSDVFLLAPGTIITNPHIIGESTAGYGMPVEYYVSAGATSYNWSVTGGRIISGQGTRRISVVWTEGTATGQVRVSYSGFALSRNIAISRTVRDVPLILNGPIHALLQRGDTVYMGGSFSYIGPNTGSGILVQPINGDILPIFPKVNGPIYAAIPDGAGGWYIGGDFTVVGGLSCQRIARIAPDGSVYSPIQFWTEMSANGPVYALALSAGVLYVGGDFTTLGGSTRNCAGAFSTTGVGLQTWNPNANGSVRSIAVSGSTVYIGGDFTTLGGSTRNRAGALSTDGVLQSWDPNANGSVRSLAVSGSTVYIGGDFTTLGSSTRNRAGAVSTAGVLQSWDPNANGSVRSIAVSGSTVYIGGDFTTVGGTSRNRLAAVSTAGALSTWNPSSNGRIHTIFPKSTMVYVGGDFTAVGGTARRSLAVVDVGTGAALSWSRDIGGDVYALAESDTTLYIGGSFLSAGGFNRNNIAAIEVSTASVVAWNPDVNGLVRSLAEANGVIYMGGDFSQVSGISRSRLAAVQASSATLTAWNPGANASVLALTAGAGKVYAGGAFTTIGGQGRNYIAELDAANGAIGSWDAAINDTVFALSNNGTLVYAGGNFVVAGGSVRNNIAAFTISNGSLSAWNPTANGRVRSLSLAGNTVYAGGDFTSMGGQSRNRIAAINALTGVVTTWSPDISGGTQPSVHAVHAGGNIAYAGGQFTSVNAQNRNFLSGMNVLTFATSTWNPNPNSIVRAITTAGGYVHIGGDFRLTDSVNAGYYAMLKDEGGYSLSGTITGVAGPGVTITVSNGDTTITAVSGSGGTFRVDNIPNGTYSVIPFSSGFTFTPERRVVSIRGTDLNGENFHSGCASPQIVGDSKVGFSGAVQYFLQDYASGTYTWSISGGTILSGQGSRSISVSWGLGNQVGSISVSGVNACGAYSTTSIVDISSYVRDLPISVNGPVRAMVRSNNILYIGGDFTRIGNKTGTSVPLQESNSLPLGVFPRTDSTIHAIVSDGAGGWYIGGDFTRVGGLPRQRVARINADGTVHPWSPAVSGSVRSMILRGNTVYIGGDFLIVGVTPRNRIAAIDALTGTVLPWNPNVNGSINTIVEDRGNIYIGGSFTLVGGQSRERLACIDGLSGTVTTWNPGVNGTVHTIEHRENVLYVGGTFSTIAGVSRNNLASLDITSGFALDWTPNPNGTVLSIHSSPSNIVVGGDFTNIAQSSRGRIAIFNRLNGSLLSWNPGVDGTVRSATLNAGTVYIGGSFRTVGGEARSNAAGIALANGITTNWNPHIGRVVNRLHIQNGIVYAGGEFGEVAGIARARLAAYDITTGQITDWNPGADSSIRSMVVSGANLYIGGDFTTVSGQTRERLAALDIATGTATLWNPGANGTVHALVAQGANLYAGGAFTTVGGSTRNRLAAVTLSTGLLATWNPNANGTVFDIKADGSNIYAGGAFTTIGSSNRIRIAAVDITSGAVGTLSADVNNTVRTLTVQDSIIYLGGEFTSVTGLSRNRLAAIRKDNGSVTTWSPNANNIVHTLEIHNGTVYAGGEFTSVGIANRGRIASIGLNNGDVTTWDVPSSGPIWKVLVQDSILYAGGTIIGLDGTLNGSFGVIRTNALTQTTLSVRALMQGLWNGSSHVVTPVAIELRSGGTSVGSSSLSNRFTGMLNSTGWVEIPLTGVVSGNYWLVVRHGGSLPVGSAQPMSITAGGTHTYNFTTSASAAHSATALIQEGSLFLLRMGDINGDRQKSATDNTNIQAAPGFNMSFGGNTVPIASVNSGAANTSVGIVLTVKAYMEGFWNGIVHVPTPVAVELRIGGTSVNTSNFVHVATGMLNSNGEVTVNFPASVPTEQYWIVVRHGSHLPVASNSVQLLSQGINNYNFTTAATQAHSSTALIQHSSGTFMLRVGDVNGDRQKNATDNTLLLNAPGFNMSFGGNLIPAP